MIPNIYLSDEQVREIRKKQTYLDPEWSADRENNMIRAGADMGADNAVKQVVGMACGHSTLATDKNCVWIRFLKEDWEALDKSTTKV